MHCDRHGHPDANGDYQMVDGKIVLRDGRRAHFDITMMDNAPRTATFFRDATMFTDAERQMFDSDEGKSIIAHAKMCHRLSNGYLGDRAPEFTDAQAASAIKKHVAQSEAGVRAIAQMTASADELEQHAAQARKDMIARMNGSRN